MIKLLLALNTFASDIVDESKIQLALPKIPVEAATQSEFGARYFMGLSIVAIFLVVGILIARRLNRLSPRKFSPVKMKVLNQLPLGAKKHLAVIDVAGEQILIGVTDHHISMLKNLSLLDEDMAVPGGNSFKEIANGISSNDGLDQKFKDYTEDEFTISKAKNLIRDKIKTMRPM